MQDTGWLYGGSDVLFPGLTWANRPDMTGSEASEDLQRAWVATIMAIQDVLDAIAPLAPLVLPLVARAF